MTTSLVVNSLPDDPARDEPLTVFSVTATLDGIRDQEGAPDGTIYFGVAHPCSSAPIGCNSLPDQMVVVANLSQNVPTGPAIPDAGEFCMGRSMGLLPVSGTGTGCHLGSGEPDSAYPHENGLIGVTGFGIVDQGLRSPTNTHSFMTSGCNNTWVSDYHWNQLIQTLKVEG